MSTHLDFLLQTGLTASWPAFADAAMKSLVVLAGAWTATLAMRRASAATRHLAWTLAVVGTLAVPVLSGLLPEWRILPAWMGQERVATTSAAPTRPAPPPSLAPAHFAAAPRKALLPERTTQGLATSAGETEAPGVSAARSRADAREPSAALVAQPPAKTGWMSLRWQSWALIAWGCGIMVMILRVILGLLSLGQLGRRSERLGGESWELLLRELAGRLNLRRPVLLLRGRRGAMPMTWGILRPKLLLPLDADGWSPQRQRVVIMHELAHIKRGDFLVQLVAHLARAIYWFNPLIWIASKRIAAESEGACDDRVLAQETRASDYAEHLLTVAARLKEGALIPVAAIAMARSSRLEDRLLAILDANRNRRVLTAAGTVLAAILLAGGVMPLAMIRAADRQETTKPRADAPSKPSANSAKSGTTTPATAPSAENYVDALGSVAPYDRLPAEAHGVQGPQSVPIVFSIPETYVQVIVRKLGAHQTMAVDVYDRNMTQIGHGSLAGIASQIDATTGTLTCKAIVVPVGDAVLFPNQFLNVRLHLVSGTSPDTRPTSLEDAHREVLQAELAHAKAEAAEQEALFKTRVVGETDVYIARNKVEVLEAELAGDPVRVAELKLALVRRQLQHISLLFEARVLPAVEIERAKGKVAIAEAKLREARAAAAHGGPATGAAPSIELKGHVVDDATGKPISNFSIQGGRVDDKNPAKIIWGWFLETRGSNPEGEFSANLDWSAGWRSRIVASGYVSQPVLTELPEAGAIKLEQISGTIRGMVIRMKRGRQVRGHLFDYTGKPVKDAGVYVVGNPSINLTGGKAMELAGGFVEDAKAIRVATDADGAFTVTGIGGDAQRIAVTSSALDLWVVPVPEGDAGVDNLEVHLPQPGKLIVHYDIAGAPDKTRLFLQLHTWDMPGWSGVTNDRYDAIQQHVELVLGNLPPGDYTIDRSKNLGLKNSSEEALLDCRTIRIESGKTVITDFVRRSGAPITGQIVGLDQGDVSKARPTRVYVHVQPRDEQQARSPILDTVAMEGGGQPMDGKFTTERIPPGQYKVWAQVFVPETDEQRRSTGDVPPAFAGEALVTVPERGAPEPVKIQLAPSK